MAGFWQRVTAVFGGRETGGGDAEATLVCPSCGDEYRVGFTQCVACGVPLVPSLGAGNARAERPVRLEPITTDGSEELVSVSQGGLAEMKRLQRLLEHAGIASLPVGSGPPGGGCCSANRATLQVRGGDQQAALVILDEDFRRTTGLAADRDGHAGVRQDLVEAVGQQAQCGACGALLQPSEAECPECGLFVGVSE